MRPARRSLVSSIAVLASLTLMSGTAPVLAAEPPSVRLFAAAGEVAAERSRRGDVYVDPGVWIASVGGAFELRATRPDYDTPVELVQTDAASGEVLRTLPAEMLNETWFGLSDFVHVTLRDAAGNLILRQAYPFCPNTYNRARLDDQGPQASSYPYICGGNPFTRGTVWGIDDHWAVNPLSDQGLTFRAERRRYEIRVWIDPAWVEALGVAEADAQARIRLAVVDRGEGRKTPVSVPAPRPGPRVPTITNPPADGVPDLIALPAWGVVAYQRRGHDYLAFNATEWNEGPGTLVVEGFRGVDQHDMDAYQYFLVDGQPMGRAPIGQLEFHDEHLHWHFEEFTEYSLLDADSGRVQTSGKQSWCLANTDAIDLAVPNANWAAFGGDLFTMCGGPGALWIREVLDVGWGDTYVQYIAGQAFDITDLPNGDYYIRVEVNPTGSIVEGSTDNNIEDRLVKLRGRPGARRVIVPPWHGIDTESTCYYCL